MFRVQVGPRGQRRVEAVDCHLGKTESQSGAKLTETNEVINATAATAANQVKISARHTGAASVLPHAMAQSNPDPHRVKISSASYSELKDGRITVYKHKSVVTLHVENQGSELVYLNRYASQQEVSFLTLRDKQGVDRGKTLALRSGKIYEVQAHCYFRHPAVLHAKLIFSFSSPSSGSFQRSLPLKVQFQEPLDTSYVMTVGRKPPKRYVRLMDYKLRDNMLDIIKSLERPSNSNKADTSWKTASRRLLDSPLTAENYYKKFGLLLHLEEFQMKKDIRRYVMINAPVVRDSDDRDLLVLKVQDENRPFVLRGSQVFLTEAAPPHTTFSSKVHDVQADCLKLTVSKKLLPSFDKGMKFNVEFTLCRLTMRIMHRAAEKASETLGKVLFPTEAGLSHRQGESAQLSLFDPKLEGNSEQREAVENIVAGSSKPAPYVVFGPPGTGKTTTLVAAMKQIEKAEASCHILACTQSNMAADLLWRKLVEHVDKGKVFRMYAQSWFNVPQEIRPYSNWEDNKLVVPPVEKLEGYKVMVTTLFTASRLVTEGVPEGHYTHIFVDEAGQAAEPECIIPLAGLLDPEKGQVVLAGDPKQLGPIFTSNLAKRFGLGVSLVERLMETQEYKKNERKVFTKLRQNYRSHREILWISNKLFYEGELLECADEEKRNHFCNWEKLPKKNFPLIFREVMGREEREQKGTSFFNTDEVEILMCYLKDLLSFKVAPEEIGIISPYRKQVEKIKQSITIQARDFTVNMENLKVGTVEEFQGDERLVILVSTVRSSNKTGQELTLGFVNDKKRFNVAITRAQALLIVVGNPKVLKTSEHWNQFIEHCKQKGGYLSAHPSAKKKIHD